MMMEVDEKPVCEEPNPTKEFLDKQAILAAKNAKAEWFTTFRLVWNLIYSKLDKDKVHN